MAESSSLEGAYRESSKTVDQARNYQKDSHGAIFSYISPDHWVAQDQNKTKFKLVTDL